MQGVQGSNPAATPKTGHHGDAVPGGAPHLQAIVPHNGEQGLGGVNAVEEQVGMMRQDGRRPIGQRSQGGCGLGGCHLDHPGKPAHGGGAEHRHASDLSGPVHGNGVRQRGRHRFVEEKGLAGSHDLARLFEVRSAIDTENHHRIHLGTNLLDTVEDAHAKLVAQQGGVPGDPVGALRQVRAATGKSGDHTGTRHMIRTGRIIQAQGELLTVRRIEANEAHAKGFGHGGTGQKNGASHRPQDGDAGLAPGDHATTSRKPSRQASGECTEEAPEPGRRLFCSGKTGGSG